MFGNKREKIYLFLERLKDYKALSLRCLVMIKNKSGTLDGMITHIGTDFIEVSDQSSQFISIPLSNIDGVVALAKEEWKRPQAEKRQEEVKIERETPPKPSRYMTLGEVDY
jgi:hypothetical protein